MLVESAMEEDKNKYVHQSFRPRFSNILLNSKYSELEITDLTGHNKFNIVRNQ